MPFYTFRQNNSGGWFDAPAIALVIEADNADEANDIAQKDHGVYFDDDYDIDCECCGNRWYRVTEWDATGQPEVYGQPAEEYESGYETPSVKVVRK